MMQSQLPSIRGMCSQAAPGVLNSGRERFLAADYANYADGRAICRLVPRLVKIWRAHPRDSRNPRLKIFPHKTKTPASTAGVLCNRGVSVHHPYLPTCCCFSRWTAVTIVHTDHQSLLQSTQQFTLWSLLKNSQNGRTFPRKQKCGHGAARNLH